MEQKYPDLSDAKIISFDIETFDPQLKEKGTGVYRNDGYILGVSICTDTGFSEYYNLGHFYKKDTRMNEQQVIEKFAMNVKTYNYSHYGIDLQERRKNINYLKKVMASDADKLGANIKYDMDWLENWLGIKIKGKLHDVQIAEPLIDENRMRYNLDSLGHKYLDRGKMKTEIDAFCERNKLRGDSRKWLYLMPYKMVRKYALEDVHVPLEVFMKQRVILNEEGLNEIYDYEMRLSRLLLKMRKTGVRINEPQLADIKKKTVKKIDESQEELNNITGRRIPVNFNSGPELGFILDKLGLEYPITEKTRKPSITKPWLRNHMDDHHVFKVINDCRKYYKLNSTFLESQIGGTVVNGRIHCSFNQLKSDDYGTVSGRFSSSNPNLQFIPANDPDIGKSIRSLFIPEEGYDWIKADYSQIEVRIISHYAMGQGSNDIRQAFIDSLDTDFHQWCADASGLSTSMGEGGRKYAKRINFGIFYGMGIDLLCQQLGMSKDEGKAFMKMYHAKLPFIKNTIHKVSAKALSRGYVKTLLGRHRRFPDGEKTYKAFNSIVQGTAADIMKKAMVDTYEAGIYDVLAPHITVHDEMDVSMPRTKEGIEATREMKQIMETCLPLKVPTVADFEIGKDWGALKDFEGNYYG